MQTQNKDLDYYRKNAEEDYLTTPISVLRYISEMEAALRQPLVISSVCKCKGGAVGRTVTADFEHQICDRCGNIAK